MKAKSDNTLKKSFVYILYCADHTFYTGYTTNPQRRLRVHQSGKGAKYTRTRRPLKLIYLESFDDKSEALKREYAIKQFSRKQKEELIQSSKNEIDQWYEEDF